MFLGVRIEIDGVPIVFEDDLAGICSRLHCAEFIAALDFYDIVIDQEDVLYLHNVGFGSPEDRIHVAREDRNIFLATDVWCVGVYAILLRTIG